MAMFDRLRLQALLRITAFLLARAARRSARLRMMLADAPFVFQIATEQGAGGWFALRDGRLRYHPGLHPAPDFAQVWASAGAALAVMTSRDETALMRAVNTGQCRMQGQFIHALWFNEATRIATGKAKTA